MLYRCKEMRGYIDSGTSSSKGRAGMHDAGQAATKQASGWLQGNQSVSDLSSLRSTLSPESQRLTLSGTSALPE